MNRCICGEISARYCPVHQELEPKEFWFDIGDKPEGTRTWLVKKSVHDELKAELEQANFEKHRAQEAYDNAIDQLQQAKTKISEMSELVQDLTNQNISLTAEIEKLVEAIEFWKQCEPHKIEDAKSRMLETLADHAKRMADLKEKKNEFHKDS